MRSDHSTYPLRNLIWLISAFVFCFTIEALIVWRGTYVEYLEGGSPWPILTLTAGVAVFLSWVAGVGIVPTALVVGCAFPGVIVGRIVLDGSQDPTSHNLAPFEVVGALIFGMVMAFPSALIGRLLRRITHRVH